jgi:type II secretory pathway pseudopilin PulG
MTSRRRRDSQAGFTLAGLIVILTIIAVLIAYTVPPQWSKIMQRERELQTIFVMKQYARAIYTWSKAHGGMPTKLDQLKEARLPRVIRGPKGEYTDPLTGKVDWILIPPTAVQGQLPGAPGTPGSVGVGVGPGNNTNPNSNNLQNVGGLQAKLNPQLSPKDYVGPFIGVRPGATGKSLIAYRESETYDGWFYTINDLQIEIKNRTAPVIQVPGQMPGR